MRVTRTDYATVEWYVCPFAEWVEHYELLQHRQLHGGFPACNQREGGCVFYPKRRQWTWLP